MHNKGNFSYEIGYQTYIAGDSLASTSPSTRCGEGDLCGSSTRIPLSLFVPIIALMAWGLRLGVSYSKIVNIDHFIIPNILWGLIDSMIVFTLSKVFDAYLIVFFSGPSGTRRRFVFFHHIRGRLKHDEYW